MTRPDNLLLTSRNRIRNLVELRPTLLLDMDARLCGTTGSRQFTASDKVHMLRTSNINPGTQDFWFGGWVKVASYTNSDTILKTGGGSNGQNGFRFILNSSNRFRLCFNDSVQPTLLDKSFTKTWTVGKWHHVLVTCDRVGVATLYVDGEADADTLDISGHQATLGTTSSTLIGAYDTASLYPFNGSLCKWLYGEGTLPTPAEILALYNQGNGMYYAEVAAAYPALDAKITHAWNMNESTPSSDMMDAKNSNHFSAVGAELLSNTTFATRASGGGRTWANLVATDKAHLEHADDNALDLDAGDFAILASVYRTSTGNQVIASKYQDADNYWKLEITDAHYVRFFARASAADEIDITCSTTALSSTTTNYSIALLVDRSDSANTKVYVNGTSQSFSVNTVSADTIANTGKLYVGQLGDNSLYWNGRIAQLGIGKPADYATAGGLAACQLAAGTTLYNSGLGQYYTEIAAADRTTLGLVAWWDLSQREYDSAAAVTATDSCAGANHLTMVGAEKSTNGAMAADSDWTGTAGVPGSYDYDVTATIAAGVMTMACGGDGTPANCSVGQAIPFTSGNKYTFAGSFTRTSGSIILRATSGFDPAGTGETIETFAATNATYSETYTMTGDRTHLLMYTANSAAASWEMDNVSVKAASIRCVSDADVFGSWTEAVAGTSTVEVSSLVADAGLACRLVEDSSGSAASVAQTVLTVGNEYSSSVKTRAEAADKTYRVYAGTTTEDETAGNGSFASGTQTLTCAGTGAFKIETLSATSTQILIDTASVKSTGPIPAAGPREATASDTVGGFHGTLTNMDVVGAWSSDIPAALSGVYSLTLDGTNDYLACGNVGNVTAIELYVKFLVDDQEICTLANSTATAVTCVGGTLTFGASLTASAITVDGVSKSAAEAGALLNDNGWHKLAFTLSSIAASDLRWGTDSSAYGNIRICEVKLNGGALAYWKCDDGPQGGEPSDGDPVATAVDHMSRALFNQPTTNLRPTFGSGANGINGRPCLIFPGTVYLRRAAATLSGNTGDIIMVVQTSDKTQLDQTVFSQADEAGADNHLQFKIRDDGTNVGMTVEAEIAGVTTVAYSDDAPLDDTTYIYEMSSDGSACTETINGTSKTISGTDNGKWFNDPVGQDNTVIGALVDSAGASQFGYLKVALIAAWDTKQPAGKIAEARRLLAAQYGVTLA